jgi:hypothetical protein
VQAAIFKVLISDAPSESKFLCRSIPGKCLQFIPRNDPRMLALRVTLRLQEDKPSTHQNVCGGRFMSGGQMDKAQHKNVLTQKTGLAMHKKMRFSLTSVSGLRLKVRRRKT